MTTELPKLPYSQIKQYFLNNLFSEEEAEWAAINNLQPADKRVQKVVRNRELKISYLMRYLGDTEEEAIADAAKSVQTTNRAKAEYEGIVIEDYNLFMGDT